MSVATVKSTLEPMSSTTRRYVPGGHCGKSMVHTGDPVRLRAPASRAESARSFHFLTFPTVVFSPVSILYRYVLRPSNDE